MNQQFKIKYSNILATKSYKINQCAIWTGPLLKPRNKYGRINCCIAKNNYKQVLIHKLAKAIALNVPEDEISTFTGNNHISHLCHNCLCVNPSHLSVEPQLVNNSRMSCRTMGFCLGHDQYDQCKLELHIDW